MDNKFNNYKLTDDEVLHIINVFEKNIKFHSIIMGKYNEDCMQEIKYRIYKSLTKNRK